MAARYSLARSKARELLRKGCVHSLPVPVEELAEQVVGAVIRREPLEGRLSGMVYRGREGQAIIGVNSKHTSTRQRFTIAHELGHLLLHSEKHLHIDERFPIAHRSELSSSAVDDNEIEANEFAAELLMPQDILRQFVKDVHFDFADADDEEKLREIAESFQVSVQALNYRIARVTNWQ